MELEEQIEKKEAEVDPVEDESKATEDKEAPRRGRKSTTSTPKPRSKQNEPEVEEPTEIPPVAAVEEESTPVAEETVSPPSQKAATTSKANTPKPRSKRGQVPEVPFLEAVPEPTVAAVVEETPSKVEEEIPRRGGRTPYTPKPRSKRGKQEEEEFEVGNLFCDRPKF